MLSLYRTGRAPVRSSIRLFGSSHPPASTSGKDVSHDSHGHHEYEPEKSFFTGGGSRRRGGFGYGYMTEWTGTGYSLKEGSLTGLPYYPSIYGGVPEKFVKLNYANHLACGDYYAKVGFLGMLKYTMMGSFFRTTVVLRLLAVFGPILLIIMYNRRWEPVEAKMDREAFFRDFESNYYGAFFDHHAFAERLAKRRARKWAYDGQVDIPSAHH